MAKSSKTNSQSKKSTLPVPTSEGASMKEDISSNWWERNRNILSLILEAAMVISTIGALWFTKRSVEFTRESLELTKNSLDAQIKSVEETQKQFIATYEPFLYVVEPVLSKLIINKPISIKCKIVNLREGTPVKIIRYKGGIFIENNKMSMENLDRITTATEANVYVTPNGSYIVRSTSNQPLTSNFYDLLMKGDYFIYFLQEVEYQDLVTKKIKYYRFQLKLNYSSDKTLFLNNTYYEYIYNENTD